MKIKKIEWDRIDHLGLYRGYLYGALGVGWALAIIFKDEDNVWNLNYESKGPAENILKGADLEDIMQKAYEYHSSNIMEDFFEWPDGEY